MALVAAPYFGPLSLKHPLEPLSFHVVEVSCLRRRVNARSPRNNGGHGVDTWGADSVWSVRCLAARCAHPRTFPPSADVRPLGIVDRVGVWNQWRGGPGGFEISLPLRVPLVDGPSP